MQTSSTERFLDSRVREYSADLEYVNIPRVSSA